MFRECLHFWCPRIAPRVTEKQARCWQDNRVPQMWGPLTACFRHAIRLSNHVTRLKKKKKAVEHTFPFLRDKFEWKVSQSFPSGILWKPWFILSLNLDGCALCRSFQRTHSEIKRERQPNTRVLARDDLSVPQFPAARQTGSTLLKLKKKKAVNSGKSLRTAPGT